MPQEPRRRGRPPGRRAKPKPLPPLPVTIEVRDERPELRPKLVAHFENVPADWSRREILRQFGIAEHFRVLRCHRDGAREVIQEGRR